MPLPDIDHELYNEVPGVTKPLRVFFNSFLAASAAASLLSQSVECVRLTVTAIGHGI